MGTLFQNKNAASIQISDDLLIIEPNILASSDVDNTRKGKPTEEEIKAAMLERKMFLSIL